MASSLFFYRFRISRAQLRNLVLIMLVPVVSLSAVVLVSILRAESIIFTDESNFATSGGYGPNQVSVILGLGTLLAYIYFLYEDHLRGSIRLVIIAVAMVLFTQSVLTYSRGGIFNLLLPLPLVTLAAYDLPGRHKRITFFVIASVVILGYFVLPRLEIWTGGTLSQRFTDFNTSGREDIASAELDIFGEYPIFGVGPGASSTYALTTTGIILTAHTEYSRLLAEHGLLGVMALIFLALMTLRVFKITKRPAARFLALAFAAWALLDMGHAAMRLSAVSFMFGLSQAIFETESP